MRRPPFAPVILAALALVAGAAWARPPIDYQESPASPPGTGVLTRPGGVGTFQGSVPPEEPGVGAFQNLPSIDESGPREIAVLKKEYWKEGSNDPVLQTACRLGEFYTLPLNRVVMRFTAADGPATLQVVMPDYRNLLVDVRHLARPGETYLFKDTGQPDCEVFVLNPARPLRSLDPARGTSLPPPDPRELARKEAMIKAWPKTSTTAGQ